MSKIRGVGVAAVFLVGCTVGAVTAGFGLRSANAQQGAGVVKWQYYCETFQFDRSLKGQNALGAQGWELVMMGPAGSMPNWCFKRPKL